MVSKVAVIALVAIVACPILLGYAMNLSETTVTEYKPETDEPALNATKLLNNGISYTWANADTYRINSQFFNTQPIWPYFEQTSSIKGALPLTNGKIANWTGGTQSLADVGRYFIKIDMPHSINSYVSADVYFNGALQRTIDHVVQMYYDIYSERFVYLYTTSSATYGSGSFSFLNATFEQIIFRLTNIPDGVAVDYSLGYINGANSYVNMAAGYHFDNFGYEPTSLGYTGWTVELPDYTYSMLMTIDLNSITTTSAYSVIIMDRFLLMKLTLDKPYWSVTDMITNESQDLYYDENSNNNTYQMFVQYSDQANPSDDPNYPDPYKKFDRHVEFRYIGSWPSLIGAADYYLKYEFDYSEIMLPDDNNLHYFKLRNATERTPTIRMDAAVFQAFRYKVIENQQYLPYDFRTNPSTTISDVRIFGGSIDFGGNTYTVDKSGNITLGTHKVSVNKMTLSSSPNPLGGYDNKINGTTVSNTPTPSAINFNGKWSANVTTISMVQNSYNHTEWTPGQFAWDGIDQNFLMIGLLAALGSFIALGIAFRKAKSALFALAIACGGAAVLFFIMI